MEMNDKHNNQVLIVLISVHISQDMLCIFQKYLLQTILPCTLKK